ncbi:MAG: LacI family DNA-binding transcriptional regulator [Prevotella sp.]|nr:LacI family DNA-binding transcriptional regulator [Prevotella sp.]
MNIRIIDIARMAGVSTGTVDRVLHSRGRVSEEKSAKVEKVLKEINYEPNMVARFLASNKSYKFAVLAPTYSSGDYWKLVCEGIDKATDELKKFNISTEYFLFNQYDRLSFVNAVNAFKEKDFDGVLVATLFGDYVINLSNELNDRQIPYIYIDSSISGQKDLSYFGGDSYGTGHIAAKLLLGKIGVEADIVMAHIRFKYNEISVQMKTRERGFMEYLNSHNYTGKIHHIEVNPDDYRKSLNELENIIERSPGLVGGIVLNSRIYELVTLLDKLDVNLQKKIKLIGHDAIEKNIKGLKEGKISFILSQRPDLQGYDAIKAMGNYLLFKQLPPKVNYMPIDILIEENVDYYNNYKL